MCKESVYQTNGMPNILLLILVYWLANRRVCISTHLVTSFGIRCRNSTFPWSRVSHIWGLPRFPKFSNRLDQCCKHRGEKILSITLVRPLAMLWASLSVNMKSCDNKLRTTLRGRSRGSPEPSTLAPVHVRGRGRRGEGAIRHYLINYVKCAV